ncbi:spermidine synthase [Knoellia sinensis KCTC 19936]|uniref:Spermidine synthase n=1 Tax=Knoellia sinensis KCTC 19936 TaxID=1385520 RepID=A0A0A0J7G6_9MICO|nr:fused MFS/spermidine synthase [Knoellia sinensis]KGN31511.1 spermidine synthase [Knoellia sinensis KCTC 19936]
MSENAPGVLGPKVAAALVFGASAAVLVVELVSLRLLAPYLGLTLETNTMVIGIALAAIATGAWLGGKAADGANPRRLLGPLLAVSGVAVSLMPFVVRGAGEVAGASVILVAAFAILVPGALLSAVSPIVAKLRLTDLAETGTVVGSLSGIGTVGAIAGTVLTGFVFVTAFPVSLVLVGLGVLLVVAAVAVEVHARRLHDRDAVVSRAVLPIALLLPGALGAAWGPGSCDAETVYHCAQVVPDPNRAEGRTLVLDGVRHSYVDLADPTHLEFEYVQALASVADTAFPAGEARAAYHLGGGGLTLPRYLAEMRPGTTSVVSEIDRGVLDVDVERLGLETGPDLDVRIEDGRLGIRRIGAASQDLVIGDAFGGVTIPWHLTTREAMVEVDRVLKPGGVYAANLIDFGPMSFVGAEVTTLQTVFDHVVLAAESETIAKERGSGGNVVVVASDAPVDVAALGARLAERDLGWEVIEGAALDAWVGDAMVLTDDHAPVDQLVTLFSSPR